MLTLKNQLRRLIAKGKPKEAIDRLLKFAEESGNNDFLEEVIMQSSRFEKYVKVERMGRSTFSEENISLAKINIALLRIIDQFINDHDEQTKIDAFNSSSMKPAYLSRPWKWTLGIGVLIVFIFVLVSFYINSNFFASEKPTDSNTVTVLVHGKAGKHELILPNRGVVKLIYGDAVVSKQINADGEATFKQISDLFFNTGNAVEVIFSDPKGEAYNAINPDTSYYLTKGKYISLVVQLDGLERIKGIVKDFKTNNFIKEARISVQGEITYSNDFGEFDLLLPEEKQQKYQTIRVFKQGYEDFKLSNVPVLRNEEVPIYLKPE